MSEQETIEKLQKLANQLQTIIYKMNILINPNRLPPHQLKAHLDGLVISYHKIKDQMELIDPNIIRKIRLRNRKIFLIIDQGIELKKSLDSDEELLSKIKQEDVNKIILDIHQPGKWTNKIQDVHFGTFFLYGIETPEKKQLKDAIKKITVSLEKSDPGKKILESLKTSRRKRNTPILIAEIKSCDINKRVTTIGGYNKGFSHYEIKNGQLEKKLSQKTLMVIAIENSVFTGHSNQVPWLIFVLSNELFEAVWNFQYPHTAVGSCEFQALTFNLSKKFWQGKKYSIEKIRSDYKRQKTFYSNMGSLFRKNLSRQEASSHKEVVKIADYIVEYITENEKPENRFRKFSDFERNIR